MMLAMVKDTSWSTLCLISSFDSYIALFVHGNISFGASFTLVSRDGLAGSIGSFGASWMSNGLVRGGFWRDEAR